MKLGLLEKLIEKGKNGYFYNWDEIAKLPEFQLLMAAKQNPKWHSEGNAWIHTGMVCQEAINSARRMKYDGEDAYVFLASALFHDIGKGTMTKQKKNGDWTSPGHDIEGEKITRRMLWDTDYVLREKICRLVRTHMKPLQMWDHKNYIAELMDILNTGVDPIMLAELKRCDQNGARPYSGYDVSGEIRKIDSFQEWSNDFLKASDHLISNCGHMLDDEDTIFGKYGIILIGLPGAGKNTFIDTKLNSPGYQPISRDDIRAELGYCKPGEKFLGNEKQEDKVTEVFYEKLKGAFDDGYVPVINNTNVKKHNRDDVKEFVSKYYNVRWIYIYVQAESIFDNRERRRGQIPDPVFDHMMGNFDMPYIGEYDQFDTYISRNGRFDKIENFR